VTGHEGGQGGGASPEDLKLSGVTLGAKEKVGGDKVENQEVGAEPLQVWHVAHPLMYAFTNVMIPGHQKSLVINLMVFHSPGCPISPSWCCCTTLHFRFLLFGT
jgi:hypothetical protein